MSNLPIHYGPAKKVLLILGLLALGMTGLGIGIVILAGPPVGWITGGPAALFFGACAVVYFYRVFASAPVLSLTEEGVKAWRYPALRWEEIDFAEAAEKSGEIYLMIHAKDHEGYLARFGFLKRKWAQLSAALLPGSIYESSRMFAVSVTEAVRAINAELARRRTLKPRR